MYIYQVLDVPPHIPRTNWTHRSWTFSHQMMSCGGHRHRWKTKKTRRYKNSNTHNVYIIESIEESISNRQSIRLSIYVIFICNCSIQMTNTKGGPQHKGIWWIYQLTTYQLRHFIQMGENSMIDENLFEENHRLIHNLDKCISKCRYLQQWWCRNYITSHFFGTFIWHSPTMIHYQNQRLSVEYIILYGYIHI